MPHALEKTCAIEGCDGEVLSRDWCRKHYGRWYRTGDPLKVKVRPRVPKACADCGGPCTGVRCRPCDTKRRYPELAHGRKRYYRGCRCEICESAEMAHRNSKLIPCVDCGQPCQPSKPTGDWKPPADSRCRGCYHKHRRATGLGPKPICACGNAMSHGAKRCRACIPPGKRGRPTKGQTPWGRRFSAAPGLSRAQFYGLLARWKLQGRPCTYCGAPMDLIDHVIPLSRGGTNYEGNLTPCCAPCNMSKHDNLVSYWRHRKVLKAARLPVPEYQPRPKPAPRYQPRQLPVLTRCRHCPDLGRWKPDNRNHCVGCEQEIQAIKVRNRYRVSVGLPVDLRPTTRWLTSNVS